MSDTGTSDLCSQCGKACGRKRLCRLRLAHKYIAFLIDEELRKLEERSATNTRQTARKSRKTTE
jgi:hypothetical protein